MRAGIMPFIHGLIDKSKWYKINFQMPSYCTYSGIQWV
jgi:hypothetical protein